MSERTGLEIAVVGMSVRFSGVTTPEQFWSRLYRGEDCIRRFSEAEMLEAGAKGADLANPEHVGVFGTLENADLFDAELFGLNPREAELVDPQHRVLLECAWEGLESAAFDAERSAEAPVGVFVGCGANTYFLHNVLPNARFVESVGGFQTGFGHEKDHLASLLAFKLGLEGPTLTVQTSCSTGLVAVHLACQALQSGECDLAVAGSASITFPQDQGYVSRGDGFYSRSGYCRPFDAGADGTVPASGAGIVVLKRLEDALADGDSMEAVIKGSAVNNSGSRRAGYSAPSVEGQARVIRSALLTAEVDPDSVQFVEAHGSGTTLGDPVEVAALEKVYGSPDRRGPCALGSVKSNLGHVGIAAGMAGLIKTILALKNRQIPPTLHFERPNPEIDFEKGSFLVNTEPREWESGPEPRRAGVTSLGIGGTNAHVVLEEVPEPEEPSGDSAPAHLLLWSARTPAALEAATERLKDHLVRDSAGVLADVAYTLSTGRRLFEHRRMLVCRERSDALEALGRRDPRRLLEGARGDVRRSVAFVFPGLGDHYLGMGRELYHRQDAFREAVDRCSELLEPRLGLDIREVIDLGPSPSPSKDVPEDPSLRRMLAGRGEPRSDADRRLDRTELGQPALFVIEYALAELWIRWGIRPEAFLGYSLGEYVAACLAGVFSLEDALALVAGRARLIGELPPAAMLAVPFSEERLGPYLDNELSVAAVNGPELCVVAGPETEVASLEQRLGEDDVVCRRLRSRHAFHSELLRPVAEPFRELVASVERRPPEIPMMSNVTGTWLASSEAVDPDYWVRHLLRTVRFSEGLGELWNDPGRVVVEVGPGRTLSSLALQHPSCLGGSGHLAVSSLRPEDGGRGETSFLLGSLGRLWLAGAEPDWPVFYDGQRRRRVKLPTYPFERRRFWLKPGAAPAAAEARTADGRLAEMADWFYVPSWKLTALPVRRGAPTGHWLVFLDSLGTGAELADRLREAGCRVTTVEPGTDLERLDEGRFRLDPGGQEGYVKLFAALETVPEKVVHLWNLSGDPGQTLADESFDEAQEVGFYSLLFLSQALANRGPAQDQKLAVVTNGLFRVERLDPLDVRKSTLLGPVQVMAWELPQMGCRAIDLDLGDPARIDHVLAEIAAEEAGTVVARRGPFRWSADLEPVRLEAAGRPALWRRGDSYLITGGLGGIGLALAEHLARRAGARLTLLGRSALANQPEAARKVRELEELGAEVLTVAADVADEEQVRAAVETARQRFGRLDGVFHCAGVPGGGLIQLKTREAAAAVLAPKTAGTLVLQRVLASDPPDFIVYFSSTTALAGGLGQVDYCAANAFLGAAAQAGGAAGPVPAVTVDWCEWQWNAWGEDLEKLGPEVRDELERHRQRFGLTFEEGLEALERVLASGLPRVAVSTRDPRRALAEQRSVRSLLGQRTARPEGDGARAALHQRPDIGVAFVAPESEAERRLAGILQDVLGIDRVGIHDGFIELGGNSLIGLQVVSRIRQACGVELPLSALFEAPTVADLAKKVASAGGREKEETAKGLLDNLDNLDLDSLGEDDVDALLAELAVDARGDGA